jgi:two-component system NarL family sensor kinase
MVETVREQVRDALGELRSTVATLREPLITDLTLTASIKRLAEPFEQATDLTLHLDLPEGLKQLPHPYRLTLYRAAQEALTNVQRHAQASNVWLRLRSVDNKVELLVQDDGLGFQGQSHETAFGLRGMRERIAHLNGQLHLSDRDGGGAQLQILLPLPEEDFDE